MAKTKDDLEKERDTQLSEMDHSYQRRQNDLENEKNRIKKLAEEKQTKGEDCTAEIERYKELNCQQEKEFDDYKNNCEQIYNYYDNEIRAVEKEEEEEYEY